MIGQSSRGWPPYMQTTCFRMRSACSNKSQLTLDTISLQIIRESLPRSHASIDKIVAAAQSACARPAPSPLDRRDHLDLCLRHRTIPGISPMTPQGLNRTRARRCSLEGYRNTHTPARSSPLALCVRDKKTAAGGACGGWHRCIMKRRTSLAGLAATYSSKS